MSNGSSVWTSELAGIPAGSFGVRERRLNEAVIDEFKVVVHGKGAHAAQPQRDRPVMIAVQIAQSWQTIVSRNVNPR